MAKEQTIEVHTRVRGGWRIPVANALLHVGLKPVGVRLLRGIRIRVGGPQVGWRSYPLVIDPDGDGDYLISLGGAA